MSSSSPSVLETFNYLWPNIWTKNTFLGKLYVIFSLLLIFIAIAFNLSTPLFLKEAVLALSNERTFIQIAPLLLIVTYAVVWSASKIFVLISQAVAYPVEIDTARRFSLQLFNHIHELSTRYHKDRKLGELLSVIERTNSATVRLIGRPAIMLLPIFVEITVAIIVLSYFYDIRFGAVLFSMLALYSFLNYFTSDWVVESRKRQNEKDSASNSFIVDSLLHAETVKCFNTQPYEVNEAMRLLKEKEIEDTNMLQTDAKIHLAQSAIVGLCIIIMTYMSGEEVVRGNMNVGDFVFIHGYLLLFMLPLSTLGYNIRLLRNDMTQFKTAIDILNIPIEIKEKNKAPEIDYIKGDIKFNNIKFGYIDTRIILKNLTFSVRAGTTVAIVGESGSGKSTIARLLYRLYDLDDGEILIDNQNIKNITKHSLRNILGIVSQETSLFNDTLKENLVYGDPSCDDNKLKNAIKSANLESFINKLPEGLETLVGERGLKLSGGEKQRASIARMLIKNPKIFIFDEATSSLDMKTEKEIQDCLNDISEGITTIIIAHRLSTIKHADNIIVLKEGGIIEQGSHEALINKGGAYKTLWDAQISD